MHRPIFCVAAACVAALAGCGDGHEYPAGFAEQAARDEAYFEAQARAEADASAASAGSGESAKARPPRGGLLGAGASSGAGGSSFASEAAASAGADAAVPEVPASAAEGEAPEVVADRTAAAESRRIIAELKLPPPPPVEVPDGEEPFMKLARERKFDEFRRMSARYVQLKRELLPYGELIASGESTAEDRAIHAKIERAMEAEFPRINRYMWDDRWTEQDRAAMGWILSGGFTRRQE